MQLKTRIYQYTRLREMRTLNTCTHNKKATAFLELRPPKPLPGLSAGLHRTISVPDLLALGSQSPLCEVANLTLKMPRRKLPC